ncbi:DUF2339 domain-containing protein [Enterobacteriaceae bacterium ENNIH3]|nr:DUF2339 domain-containing protein [Enterobacteriaceae bacterium ENNIH3]AUV10337.1 DUF2339 domain-containing protein [Enterobacteriaceae bacterium ENNIH2]PWF51913.1 DUF2339 domain-containing protein [[Kluyvera] intestini]TCW47213.1 putative membrane protein [Phytobacter diazotrophicus]
MDGLVLIACTVLFLLLVVIPVMSILAYRRSNAARDELSRLRQRVALLEQQMSGYAPGHAPAAQETASPVDSPEVIVPDVVVPEVSVPEPQPTPEPEPVPIEPAPVNVWARGTPAATVSARGSIPLPEREEPASGSQAGGMVTALLRWFMQGNPLAKLGIILLFLGLAFLFRYSVERSLFPLELRLAVAALGAMALLFLGWRLRHKQPVFALILQGGATGALYLTVFGAFRLWQMLPMSLAFALLLLICAASVGLAVLQRALSLAMLASLGGYAAPLLLSSGGGSHVTLFSFYLLLSVGILAISVWQHWRELNLLGMFFTFGVGGVWGIADYRPQYYLSCQLFLIANLLIFGVLSVALSLRAQKKGKRIIDGVLLFAPPLIGFGMQYAITQHLTYGPALSALGYGAFYMLLAWSAVKRFPAAGKPLVLAALALGGAFTTLAIPLALSARWTAMAWALEGLGVLWLGVMQGQRRMSYSGTGLLVLALGSALWAMTDGTTAFSVMVIFAVLSATWLVAARLWRRLPAPGGLVLLAGGIAFWLVALWGASDWILNKGIPAAVLGLLALSVWGWRYMARRLHWRALHYAVWLLWPVMLVVLLWQLTIERQLLGAGWQNLAWCVALPSAYLLLLRERRVPARLSQGLHISLLWMILLAAGTELFWFVDALPWGMDAWRIGLPMAAGGIVILLLHGGIRRNIWPLRVWPALYGQLGPLPLIPLLVFLLVAGNMHDGRVIHSLYLPLVNPLEEGAAFALLGVWFWCRYARPRLPATVTPLVAPALLALAFWWINGLLLRLLAHYGGVDWDSESLWNSRLIQTSFALFWMLGALVVMLLATRRGSRHQWLGGAALLGVVIVKLMLVDSAGGGGLARAIAFIGVAVLVLIVGYFSPLPPKGAKAFSEEEKS